MKTELDKAWIPVREARQNERTLFSTRYIWATTVYRICGPDVTIQWTTTGCIVLGVMEFFYED